MSALRLTNAAGEAPKKIELFRLTGEYQTEKWPPPISGGETRARFWVKSSMG
jgi:hypothetical protein